MLGPIKVRVGTGGSASKAIDRMPACTEAVTYLSTRPGGATTQEVADALGISDGRVRQDMSIVRAWLGDNPATGRTFLPGATEHPLAVERGVGLYLIEDLLCDADLFKRLRLRGEARGPDGINDLRTALRLVNGAPYDGLRTRGGAWLAGNPLDHHLLCSIVDVAHIVSTIALETGDLDRPAQQPNSPSSPPPPQATPQLDLAAVAAKTATAPRRPTSPEASSGGATPPVSRSTSQTNDAILRTHRWLERASQPAWSRSLGRPAWRRRLVRAREVLKADRAGAPWRPKARPPRSAAEPLEAPRHAGSGCGLSAGQRAPRQPSSIGRNVVPDRSGRLVSRDPRAILKAAAG